MGGLESSVVGSRDRGYSIGGWEMGGVDNIEFVTTKALLTVTKKNRECMFGFGRFALAAPRQLVLIRLKQAIVLSCPWRTIDPFLP
jgi:hypothetical protein